MSFNPNNNGNITGRLAADPREFVHADGSKTVTFTVMVDRNYTNRKGERLSDAINVEHFIAAGANGKPRGTDRIHKGDHVRVDYALRQDTYRNKAGETVYEMKVAFDQVTFQEPRTVTQARLDKRATEATAAQPSDQEARIAELMAQNEALRQQATQAAPTGPSLQDDLPF